MNNEWNLTAKIVEERRTNKTEQKIVQMDLPCALIHNEYFALFWIIMKTTIISFIFSSIIFLFSLGFFGIHFVLFQKIFHLKLSRVALSWVKLCRTQVCVCEWADLRRIELKMSSIMHFIEKHLYETKEDEEPATRVITTMWLCHSSSKNSTMFQENCLKRYTQWSKWEQVHHTLFEHSFRVFCKIFFSTFLEMKTSKRSHLCILCLSFHVLGPFLLTRQCKCFCD